MVGRTNRWGDLLVPDLLAYQASTFSIDDEDIPIDYEIDRTSLMTAPPYRGGAIVRFDGRRVRAFRGRVPAGRYDASVIADIGRCAFTLTIPSSKALVTTLGELRCDAAPK